MAAILSYVDEIDLEKVPELHLETLQPFVERLIQKEMKKAMKDKDFSQSLRQKNSEKVLNLSSEENELAMDDDMTQNIMNVMDIFRRT